MGFLGQKKIKFGPIVNISMGGLAVQYIENKTRMKKYKKLSIAVPGDNPILDQIQYEIIADYKIADLPDGKKIRNQCLKFRQMTSYHTFQLDDFIREYSIGFIMDRRNGEERRKCNDPAWEKTKERRSGEERRAYPVIL